MASPQPRHGELQLRCSNKIHSHWQKIRWALNTCQSGFYMLGDTLDLLSLAVQCTAMLSDNEAANWGSSPPNVRQCKCPIMQMSDNVDDIIWPFWWLFGVVPQADRTPDTHERTQIGPCSHSCYVWPTTNNATLLKKRLWNRLLPNDRREMCLEHHEKKGPKVCINYQPHVSFKAHSLQLDSLHLIMPIWLVCFVTSSYKSRPPDWPD